MTGFKSKKAAALDEEGMYLVHHTKRKVDDDDDIQDYKRPWGGLTDEETSGFTQHEMSVVKYVSKVLKEKNNG